MCFARCTNTGVSQWLHSVINMRQSANNYNCDFSQSLLFGVHSATCLLGHAHTPSLDLILNGVGICVFLQGGYATYRYAQPAAATSAAYSDR